MIMISDLMVRPANQTEIQSVETPQSLLIMSAKHADDVKKYSWNYNKPLEGEDDPFFLTLSHEYIDRCYLLDTVRYVVLSIGLLNLVISFVWTYFVWRRWHRQTMLHKWLLVLPLSSALFQLQYSLDMFTCPWDNLQNMAVYLAMLSEQLLEVLTLIISNTITNSLFYMMGHGWCITVFNITRPVITNTVLIGGSLYLLMLAKDYSSSESSSFAIFFTLSLMTMYVCIQLACTRNINQQLRILN
jgi:hypothetical protein